MKVHCGEDCGSAWVGLVIAKSQCDCEKMRKYAMAIQKFERLLNIEINEFPELGLYASGDFDNKEEDEDDYVEIDFDSL